MITFDKGTNDQYFKNDLTPDSSFHLYQAQETVFHQDIQTPRRELKIIIMYRGVF